MVNEIQIAITDIPGTNGMVHDDGPSQFRDEDRKVRGESESAFSTPLHGSWLAHHVCSIWKGRAAEGGHMSSGCDRVLMSVKSVLGKLQSVAALTTEDFEVAFLHVRRCRSCRNAMTLTEYRMFMDRMLLERE